MHEPGRRAAVAGQQAPLQAAAGAQDFDPIEQARLHHLADLVERALLGSWPVVN